nr:transposase [Desulforhopalus sp. IMCC35007]
MSDCKVKLHGHQFTFRQITYRDPETSKEYRFLTNSRKVNSPEVAAIYKERWQIELFFKCIKQNLRGKTFLGTSQNAILTQLWIALCVYLLLCFFQVHGKISRFDFKDPQALAIEYFERRPLSDLLIPPDKAHYEQISLQLLWS